MGRFGTRHDNRRYVFELGLYTILAKPISILYQYGMLTEHNWRGEGKPYFAQCGLKDTEGAMKQVLSAKNSID